METFSGGHLLHPSTKDGAQDASTMSTMSFQELSSYFHINMQNMFHIYIFLMQNLWLNCNI